MYGKTNFKYDSDDNLIVERPQQPSRRADFRIHSCSIWIAEGVIKDNEADKSEQLEHLTICPVTGLLMCLSENNYNGGNEWHYLNDGFQKAYKKWANKQAEKALLGK